MVHNSAYSALHTLHKSLLQWVVKIGARLRQLATFLGHILFHIGAFHPMLGLS